MADGNVVAGVSARVALGQRASDDGVEAIRVTDTGAVIIGFESQTYTLLSASESGAGTSRAAVARHITFNVAIAGTATVALEVSWDDTNWYAIRTSTATEQYSIAEWYPYIRANVTSWTSGAVLVQAAEFVG